MMALRARMPGLTFEQAAPSYKRRIELLERQLAKLTARVDDLDRRTSRGP